MVIFSLLTNMDMQQSFFSFLAFVQNITPKKKDGQAVLYIYEEPPVPVLKLECYQFQFQSYNVN